MGEQREFFVTYRADEDAPTSTCLVIAKDEETARSWYANRGMHVMSVTPKESAPSWMGEGKTYDTVKITTASPAPADEAQEAHEPRIASLERRLARKTRRIERLMRDVQDLADRATRAEDGFLKLQEATMQAIVAALLWGECGIDVAASARISSDVRNNLLDDPMTIYVGAQQTVTLSLGAADLLSLASQEKNIRGIGSVGPHSTWRYDLRKVGEDHGNESK